MTKANIKILCPVCNVNITGYPGHWIRHAETMHDNGLMDYVCPEPKCGQSFVQSVLPPIFDHIRNQPKKKCVLKVDTMPPEGLVTSKNS